MVTRGTTEVWTLHNGGDMTHNFPVHDVQFRVVSVNGKEPEPSLRGPKDTIAMPLGATVKISVRFDGPSDPDHPYMYHCHLLDHEDHGMMGQFVVVDKGWQAGHVTDRTAGHSGGHAGH
ncbi:multicopper oxidase domain-containing protein [Streptomyces sp. NPDC051320]|uniref:multicopper oxidase domain-containing protein n=1 Tax=Streptomyces sp. NPDC051320 TaxID=3154644 RepID=UPI00343C1188